MAEEVSSNEKLPESELCTPCLYAGFKTKATKQRNGTRLCDDCEENYKLRYFGDVWPE
jgi:hypothetical protein